MIIIDVFSEWEADGHMICVCSEKGEKVRFERWSLDPECFKADEDGA